MWWWSGWRPNHGRPERDTERMNVYRIELMQRLDGER